jgi:hypothetical protein
MAKRSRGRPRKYPTNADRQKAYRVRRQQEITGAWDQRGFATKLRGAIARAKARGELPSRRYAVWVPLGHRYIEIHPGGYGSQESVSDAEVGVLIGLAARYSTRRSMFRLSIKGIPVNPRHALSAPDADMPSGEGGRD